MKLSPNCQQLERFSCVLFSEHVIVLSGETWCAKLLTLWHYCPLCLLQKPHLTPLQNLHSPLAVKLGECPLIKQDVAYCSCVVVPMLPFVEH